MYCSWSWIGTIIEAPDENRVNLYGVPECEGGQAEKYTRADPRARVHDAKGSKSAGSGYRIEPPVHRSNNAENFSAHQLVTYQAAQPRKMLDETTQFDQTPRCITFEDEPNRPPLIELKDIEPPKTA